jgi:4'-phosphopantetheinyl transferase
MPLLRIIELEKGRMALWKIKGDESEYSAVYPYLEKDPAFQQNKHSRRRLEMLASRSLLMELLGEVPLIHYGTSGQPYLPGKNIRLSISHSAAIAAVILYEKQVGIDVESLGRPFEKIAPKFLSVEEQNFIRNSGSPEKMNLLCWCAKEAVFKWQETRGVDFIHQIQIQPFQASKQGNMKITFVDVKRTFHLIAEYFFIENNAVVWCVQS